jgi:hypothetical protein
MTSIDTNAENEEQLPTILVRHRASALHDDALGMKCDGKEIPDPLEPAASYLGKEQLTWKDVVGAKSNQSRWIAVGSFTGKARMPGTASVESIATGPGQPVAMTIVETEDRLLGILGPDDQSQAAIWWAWPLDALAVQTEGVQGTFRKRPRRVSIGAFGSQVDLLEISSVRNDKSSFTMGKEAAFLKALGLVSRA